MSILSIQSHVAYGYVGNKAAVYPLQSMGYDVWPINTVQFSNHTGYKKWEGQVFDKTHIKNIITGIESLGVIEKCQAVLSGYMGSADICFEVLETINRLKARNRNLIYLCDPVIGDKDCYVKPEVLDFFKNQLKADIVTPNQFEAEILSGFQINSIQNLKLAAKYFHSLGVSIVVITGLQLPDFPNSTFQVFASDDTTCYLINTKKYNFHTEISGTGDLLSALYLGNYIASKNVIKSLQNTVYYIDKVLYNTFQAKAQELQVISTHYGSCNAGELPNFKVI